MLLLLTNFSSHLLKLKELLELLVMVKFKSLQVTTYLNTSDNSLFTVWARIDLSITMILNIYFEEAEKLFLAALANTFASQLPHRRKFV